MVTNAPLVWFRILFGLLMLIESWGAIGTGWVREVFVTPAWTFPLRGFESLRVLSGGWMIGYFGVMGLAAAGVMLGYRYRASAALLALLWTGAYLAQKSHYNNHYYLAVLISWGMAFLPAHRARSLDVTRGRVERRISCHPWIHRAFRLQLLIVFSYAAIAKFYPGWLNGDYLATNLGQKGERWLVGPLLTKSWFQLLTTYTAIIFDALVIPALMWRRTRWFAFAALVAFNLFNSLVFQIGIFPYMVIALAVFFFVDLFEPRALGESRVRGRSGGAPVLSAGLRALLLGYFALQVALPLRHHLIPGDVTWTEGGHRMSWRMMLRSKNGALIVSATDRSTGRTWVVPQGDFLTPLQQFRTASDPEFVYQFVQILKDHYAREGIGQLSLHAIHSVVSLNGGVPQPLFDRTVDLATVDWSYLGRESWILDRKPR